MAVPGARNRLGRRRGREGRARLCAPHVRRQWLAGDRRDAPLDRGNRRGGDQARRRPGRRMTLLLASQSSGRAAMPRAAGLTFETSSAHVDAAALTASLLATGQTPRNIADALAEAKAVKSSSRLPSVKVLEIGRAACRERVCKYVENSVV